MINFDKVLYIAKIRKLVVEGCSIRDRKENGHLEGAF